MGKVKNYMMDIEDKVYAIDGFENKISESENTSEVKSKLLRNLV